MSYQSGYKYDLERRLGLLKARAQALLEQIELIEKEVRHGPAPKPVGLVSMREVQTEHLLRVYQACGRNKEKTARVLGLHVKTVFNWLKGIHEGNYRIASRGDAGAARLVV